MTAPIEIVSLCNPQPGAVCRSFACFICGKRHMQTGMLVKTWDTKTESAHWANANCFIDDTPAQER